MDVTVLWVGGSASAWLIIHALMLISAMLGVVMIAVQKRVLLWSPQNPVEVLQKCLPVAIIDEVTPLRYREHFEVVQKDT
jgi:hypothetical protein